jgi:hypothetical protein
MLTCDRRFLFGSTAAAALPGLLLCLLIGSPDLLADAWGVRWLKPIFPEEQRCEEGLDRKKDAVRRRTEAHAAVARDLAGGRLTLPEAAARSREADRRCPEFNWEAFRRGQPSASDDERYCRQVIAHLRCFAPLGAGPSEELARRLEGELEEQLASGTLRLPESGE